MLVYISSGKCYTYIMCRVWLWVSVVEPVLLRSVTLLVLCGQLIRSQICVLDYPAIRVLT